MTSATRDALIATGLFQHVEHSRDLVVDDVQEIHLRGMFAICTRLTFDPFGDLTGIGTTIASMPAMPATVSEDSEDE